MRAKRAPKKASTEPIEAPQNTAAMTPEEQAIFNRVATENTDFEDIRADHTYSFSWADDPFRLPPPAQKMRDEKRYAFRWITRNPARVDQIRSKPDPFRWWICNRTTTPFLADHVDGIVGGVIREDQILVFKPWHLYEAEKNYKRELADARDASHDLRRRDGETRSGVQMRAGERSLENPDEMRMEVKGSDIVYGEDMPTDRTSYETNLEQ